MSDAVITVENLSKRYLIGHRSGEGGDNTLRDVITRETRNFARKAVDVFQGRQVVQGDEVEEFWALKNVSFAIQQGEVLGIIGRNGAGKSTLLKILSRITEPTEGRVFVRGRVSSLLEVGTGFHPELTGRENIFLNGAILGMTQREIHKKFDQIVSFAGVERFIDTPVKRYSSGMYVRLAFGVAAHLEPEILIIDEVLAVGDAEFQKKCLGKIDQVSRRDGRTVLFVSHDMGAITSLCPNVIWLERGTICEHGPTRPIIDRYLAHEISKDTIVPLCQVYRPPDLRDDRLRLETLEWISGLPLRHGESVRARIRFRTRVPLAQVSIGIGFSTFDGRRLLTYDTDFQDGLRPSINRPGVHSVDIKIDSLPLAPDLYDLDLGCRSGDSHQLDYLPSAISLEIIPGLNTPAYIIRKDAAVRLACEWKWDLECKTTSTFAPLSSLTAADCWTGRRASRDT
jgi:lipopolysaccharide transport system ATP-binding protein